MTIAEIAQLESNRETKEQFGIVHLLLDGNFYRAYDWSAWLLTKFPIGLAKEKPLNVSAKRLKDNYVEAWVGFPVSSLGKYVPNDGTVTFNPVGDNQIDVTLNIDFGEATYEDVRAQVDEWKETLPMNEQKKTKREDREVSEAAPRVMRMSDILGQIISFPIESKSPMDAYEFLRQLRQKVAAMF